MIGCAGWVIERAKGASATAAISNGHLLLARPAGPPDFDAIYNEADLAVTQSGLTGDFDITVDWQAFSSNSTPFLGPRVEAGVWLPNGNGGVVAQGSAEVGRASGWASIVSASQFTTNSLNPTPASVDGAAGSFHLQRVGTSLTVTSTVNGEVVTAQSTAPFDYAPLKLFLSIGDHDVKSPDTGATSIAITKVTVSGGGGGVKSDDFSCATP
jgi:hypothetical protein